jgi:transcriptional regulator with XRE-family HTH domain
METDRLLPDREHYRDLAGEIRRVAQRARFPFARKELMSKLERAASYPGLEIIAKLATVLEVEPAELLRVSGRPNT